MKLYRLNKAGVEVAWILPELSQLPHNCMRYEKDTFCLIRRLNNSWLMEIPPEVISLYYDIVEEKGIVSSNGKRYNISKEDTEEIERLLNDT